MLKISAVIIDDNKANINLLQKLVHEYCDGVKIIGYAQCIKDAVAFIIKHKPNLLFLDISMGNENGFDLLDKVNGYYQSVIFVTAYDTFGLQAIKANATDYLLKPIEIDALVHAVEKSKAQIALKSRIIETREDNLVHALKKLSVPTTEGYLFLDIDSITDCEACGNYTKIYLDSGGITVSSMNLSHFESVLPTNLFYRVHAAHLVNLNFVVKYIKGRGGHLIMTNGKNISVAANRKQDFIHLINECRQS